MIQELKVLKADLDLTKDYLASKESEISALKQDIAHSNSEPGSVLSSYGAVRLMGDHRIWVWLLIYFHCRVKILYYKSFQCVEKHNTITCV